MDKFGKLALERLNGCYGTVNGWIVMSRKRIMVCTNEKKHKGLIVKRVEMEDGRTDASSSRTIMLMVGIE